jgi:hypothetical protein
VEAEHRDVAVASTPDPVAAVRRANRVTRVLDDAEAVLPSERVYRVEGARLAAQVDGDDDGRQAAVEGTLML